VKYEILLFELVGVLVEDSDQSIQAMREAAGMSSEEFWEFGMASPAVRDFDSGRTSSREFGEKMVEELNLPFSSAEFLQLFGGWIAGLYEGTEALLSELSGSYRLGCFSNINEIMWLQIRDKHGMGRLLNDYFLSYEMGMLKPDTGAFEYVIRELDIMPDRIAFFDDSEANVKGAEHVGMNSFVTKGLPELQDQLRQLGLL